MAATPLRSEAGRAAAAVLCAALGACVPAIRHLPMAPPDPRPGAAEWVARARDAERSGDLEQALLDARYALSFNARDPDVLALAGAYLTATGRLVEAEGAFRRALDIRPLDRAARIGLAWLLLRDRRPREGLALVDGTGTRFADEHVRGALLIAAGAKEAGLSLLRSAKTRADNDPSVAPPIAVRDIDCRLASAGTRNADCPLGPTLVTGADEGDAAALGDDGDRPANDDAVHDAP